MFLFFAKNLALGENFLSPTLNIIQPIYFVTAYRKSEKSNKLESTLKISIIL